MRWRGGLTEMRLNRQPPLDRSLRGRVLMVILSGKPAVLARNDGFAASGALIDAGKRNHLAGFVPCVVLKALLVGQFCQILVIGQDDLS